MARSTGGGIGGTAAGLAALGLFAAVAVALTKNEAPRFTPEPIGPAYGPSSASGELPGFARTPGAHAAGVRAPEPGKMTLVKKGMPGAPGVPPARGAKGGPAMSEGGACGGGMAAAPPPAKVAASGDGGSCGGAMAMAPAPMVPAGAGHVAAAGGDCGMMAGAGGGGGCGCGAAMAAGKTDDGCGCAGAGGAGCDCAGDVTAKAAKGKGAHMDHTAHHGGYVGMLGDVHVELVRTAVHEWRLYLTDATRTPVDALGGTAEIEFIGDTGLLGKLAMVVSINGKFFAGRMNPPAGASAVSIRAAHPRTGPVKMDMAFPPVVPKTIADGTS